MALMVMEVVTLSIGRSAIRRRMSARESIATPTFPTSPSARGWSESYPICVGRSKAQDRPVWPASSRNLNRSLVDSADPNPAYWRMVHSFERYISGCTPRGVGKGAGLTELDARGPIRRDRPAGRRDGSRSLSPFGAPGGPALGASHL